MFVFRPAFAGVEAGNQKSGAEQVSVSQSSNQYYIRIAKANDYGVSLNYFDSFDTQGKNIVLLNSPVMNTKVAQAPAQTIVLIVDSGNFANIKDIRVEGHAADVVLAAPKGIRCNGCSIHNAERVTLATGTIVSDYGELETIKITNGSMEITGEGLKATDLSLLDIAAGRVLVDAPFRTNMKGSLSTRNNQEVKEIDAAGDLEVSNGDVQIIVGQNHFRYSDRQSDAYYKNFSEKDFSTLYALEITSKGKLSVGNLHLESTYDNGAVFVGGLIKVQGAWSYVGRYNDQSVVPLESVKIRSNGHIYLSDQIIAANKVDIETTNSVDIAALSAGDGYLLDGILGTEVNIAAVGSINNKGAIAAESAYFSAENITNEGDIEATRDLYFNGKSGVANQYGGVILGENIKLTSYGDVINGQLYPFKSSELCAYSRTVNSSSSAEVGGKLAVPPFKGCGKVAVDSLSAYILGQNIKVVAFNFINANPYEVSRNSHTEPELNLDYVKSSQVVVSAESILELRVKERFWNMSAIAESWTGNVVLQVPIIDNERYHIWADTYKTVIGDPNGTHTDRFTQYIKALSPPARINVGGSLVLKNSTLNNEHSSVEVRQDVVGTVKNVWMEGLQLREIDENTTVTHHSRRYCTRRVLGHCMHHHTDHWKTSVTALVKNEVTAEYPFIFYVDGHIYEGFGSDSYILQNITFGPYATAYTPRPETPKDYPSPSKYLPIVSDGMTIFIVNPAYQ
ncbi:filamentous hemagglutinin N-terminal domain-containing protein [Vibrio mangrovi]|uniref:two-partner secretion domain-containing protein n=1 Tax=Vibrio mangrovi TaxID=474394 RepID=UPI0013566929|nr:filamentous hemagglutinin N-terminal domain-containing protein [Vibrio mangrovi]